MVARLETALAALLHGSRWIMAPCYAALSAALAIILVEFFRELIHAIADFASLTGAAVILVVLKLIDLLLVGNLVLIMAFAGVETLLSPAASAAQRDRPDWMGKVGFSDLKLKVIASMIAIASVQLLESFMNIDGVNKTNVLWQIAILLTFVVAGVLLAWMDRLAGGSH